MNFYDVLAAEKWGGGIPTTNFFDLLFAQYISGEQWQIYEGTLPATIIANGDDMRQYQIYGNTGGVGDRTENLYNKNNAILNFEGYVNKQTYTVVESAVGSFSIIVPVEPNTTYTVVKPATSRFRVGLFTSYPYVGEVATAIYGDRDGDGMDYGTSLTFTTSSNTSYILVFIRNYNDTQTTNEQMKNLTMVLKGTTPPASYVPFGYEVDISTSDGTTATTTPIYIGDDPLGKDEYVDYETQKVYRRTINIYNTAETTWSADRTILDDNGNPTTANSHYTTNFTAVEPETQYKWFADFPASQAVRVYFYDNNRAWISRTSATNPTSEGMSFATPANCHFCQFQIYRTALNTDNWQVIDANTTPPETYIPYLQSADPPVTLPALPTCEGETVIDYAGESVAQPEKVVLEYKRGGS